MRHEAVNFRSEIGGQDETVAGLQNTKEELEREIDNVWLRVQGQMEAIGRLERDAEMTAASATAMVESPATCAMLTSERDSLLEAMPRAKAISGGT